jgi:hypothetical protein
MSTSDKEKGTGSAAAASKKSGKGMSGTNPDDGSIKYGTGGGGTPPKTGQTQTDPKSTDKKKQPPKR